MTGSLLPIREIIAKLDIPEAFVEPCGTHIAKLRLELLAAPRPATRRKLVLVTAMTSTSSGEGEKRLPPSVWPRPLNSSARRPS